MIKSVDEKATNVELSWRSVSRAPDVAPSSCLPRGADGRVLFCFRDFATTSRVDVDASARPRAELYEARSSE